MLNNKKCILVYNLNDEELQKLKRLPFKVIEITKEMTSMTVKNIIEGLEIETISENRPEEKVILFNNFQQRIDMFRRTLPDNLQNIFLQYKFRLNNFSVFVNRIKLILVLPN